jgi:hypothetical protein
MQRATIGKHRRTYKWIEELSPDQRAELAKSRIRMVADQIDALLHLHESNRILIYTDTVTSKIPRSYAAHTYNLISDCLFQYQLVRLCALWDDPTRKGRASLPVVAELIRNKKVRRILVCERHNWQSRTGGRILSNSNAKCTIRSMLRCIKFSDEVQQSIELIALRGFRNDHVAHCLQNDKATVNARPEAKFGQEEQLLEKTLELVRLFALDLAGTNYSWEEYRRQHKQCASELWESMKFSISYQPKG